VFHATMNGSAYALLTQTGMPRVLNVLIAGLCRGFLCTPYAPLKINWRGGVSVRVKPSCSRQMVRFVFDAGCTINGTIYFKSLIGGNNGY